jgi:16S rRNA (cytosine1402-N4)-methyltransferase
VQTPVGDAASGYEIFIKFLPRDVTETELETIFAPCGALAKPPALLRDFATGAPKGCGWVTFATSAGAAGCLAMDGYALRGRHLALSAATCRKERPGLKGAPQAPGTHTPALLLEVLAALIKPDPDGIYVDATFGRGGHSRAMLEALSPRGALHAFDMDPVAVASGRELASADARFAIHAGCFGGMLAALPAELRGSVAGVLFDLGISSPQLDDPSRGFRPEADGPLDLRFDIGKGTPAWEILATASREELAALLLRNGEGQDAASAARVADAVVLARETAPGGAPRTTAALGALVAAARCGGDYQPMHAAKLTFQALRMHVNDEFGQLRAGLEGAMAMLRPGGRMGIITWKHSECAVVMDFVRANELAGDAFPLREWWERTQGGKALPRSEGIRRGAPRRPGEAELARNSRARSAVLHVLHKEEGVTVAAVEKAAHKKLGWAPLPTQAA